LILCSHGTAVSGIIGAVKGNNFCTVGIAYNVTLNGKISIINLAELFPFTAPIIPDTAVP
jgi:subtilisin family serine protease